MKKKIFRLSVVLSRVRAGFPSVCSEQNPAAFLSFQNTIALGEEEQSFIGLQTPGAMLRARLHARRQRQNGRIPGQTRYAVYGPFIQ